MNDDTKELKKFVSIDDKRITWMAWCETVLRKR